MNLGSTIKDMVSEDTEAQIRAEYYQCRMRYDALHQTVIKAEAGTLENPENYDIPLIKAQKSALGQYLMFLEVMIEKKGYNVRKPELVDGNTSDGYHTFTELYYHRTLLFAMLCRSYPDISWKSRKHDDGTMYDGMFIAGIDTPFGQYTYHCENYLWDFFEGVPELMVAPKYDGHKPSDILRLFSLCDTK